MPGCSIFSRKTPFELRSALVVMNTIIGSILAMCVLANNDVSSVKMIDY